jgi:hypothetical protein
MFVRSYSFTVTEHDSARPWIVLGVERQTVELDETVDFYSWAHEQWAASRFTVQLDSWQQPTQGQ